MILEQIMMCIIIYCIINTAIFHFKNRTVNFDFMVTSAIGKILER